MRKFIIAIAFICYMSRPALAVVVLPDPTTIVDGLPIVRQFDEFLSYNTQLLTQFSLPALTDRPVSATWISYC
ncbi:MAG: hypothetical protein Q8R76_06620 [Candidatus Omnitrophota bacterium]|nr:hypothetical protein [Candidatus Omnitrophota bacterium]